MSPVESKGQKRFFKNSRVGKMLCWSLILVGVCLITLGIAYQVREGQKEDPELVLRYADNQPEDYPTSQGAIYFANLVSERTDGRIQILVYADAKLGREEDVVTQLQYGGIDFARVSISQLAGIVPKLNVLQMPYLYRSSEHMWSVLDGEIGQEFLQEVEDQNLIGLSWYDAGTRNFYNSVQPIQTLEDIQGMRIRVQESPLMSDVVTSLGAIPVQLSYDEVYSAIEVGTVAGAENNWPSYESMLHYEVAPYFTQDEHTRIPEIQICSAHTWELLSEEDQAIILQAAKESALYERELWAEREADTKRALMAQGVQVVELDEEEKLKFQNAVSGVYEKYCQDDMDLIDEIIQAGMEE